MNNATDRTYNIAIHVQQSNHQATGGKITNSG